MNLPTSAIYFEDAKTLEHRDVPIVIRSRTPLEAGSPSVPIWRLHLCAENLSRKMRRYQVTTLERSEIIVCGAFKSGQCLTVRDKIRATEEIAGELGNACGRVIIDREISSSDGTLCSWSRNTYLMRRK